MLYLQILAFVASASVGILFLGVSFINSWHVRVKTGAGPIWTYLFAGVPLVSLAAWLPFAFGWV